MANNNNRGRLKAILPIILILLILIPFGYSLVGSVTAKNQLQKEVFLEMPDEIYENCVRETEYMRFQHWELLRGIREEVVRYGKRGDTGLYDCSRCHTKREEFCDKCHNAVSMHPDCFHCHYYP